MTCLQEGFQFWLGKTLAELIVGFAFMAVAAVTYLVLVWYSRRK